jgi:hypothetical protein
MNDQISTLDGTQTEAPATPAPAKRARKSSAAAKLLQAAALAAVLVPLGSVAAEASTCHFGGSGSCASNAGSEGFTLFEFGSPEGSAPYKIGLKFDTIVGEFDVTIDDIALSEAAMLAKLTAFPGFQPVPIGDNPVAPFIDFQVTAPAPCFVTPNNDCSTAENTWLSEGVRGPAADQGYDMRFYWLADTNALFPDPHVLHNTGEDDELYDFDMTVAGSYSTFVPCDVFACIESAKAPGDPAVGGRDDMFNGFTLADPTGSTVPEPASLLLLGTGISGWLYRRRRGQK